MRLAFSPSGHTYPGPGLSGMTGLGLDPQTQQIAAVAAQGAATTGAILTGLANMGVIAAAFGPAAPIAAAVAGLVAVGLAIANQFQGCGQTCIRATEIADKLQIYWQQNLDTYMNAPVHFASLQAAALNNFEFGVQAMTKACGDPSLGDAGVRCINERLIPTACAIRDANGGCHNAWIDFYNPIKNDPHVVPDPPEASAIQSSVSIGGTSFPLPVLLVAGGLILFTMMSDN